MPLHNTRVIPERWSEHHRPTAEGTMSASCAITRRDASAGTTNAAGKWTPAAPTTVYTGPCRVQVLKTRQQVVVVGEAQETRRRYLVTIRWDSSEIHIGDLVGIVASVDPGLPGKQLRVKETAYGSEQWERDLTCEELED